MNTTAKAIIHLRQKLGFTQQQFAEKLGVSLFSVSRYESGREPSREVIGKLARLAAANSLEDTHKFFDHMRRVDIEASYKNRPSPGTGRHVPLSDLKVWSAYLQQIREDLKKLLPELSESKREIIRSGNLLAHVEILQEDLELYIGRDPVERYKESKNILAEEQDLIRLDLTARRRNE